jgi:hypothetical protein
MPVGFVFVPVEQAKVLHQARHEVERGFLVLHAIIDRRKIRPQYAELEIEQPLLLENGLDDVRNGLVLENPAIGSATQEPQARHHLQLVKPGALRGVALPDQPLDVAMNGTPPVGVVVQQPQGDRHPEQGLDGFIGLLGLDGDAVMEAARQGVLAFQRDQQCLVRAKRRVDCKQSRLLRIFRDMFAHGFPAQSPRLFRRW